MKKILVILLCFAMMTILAACKEKTDNESTQSQDSSQSQESSTADNSDMTSDESIDDETTEEETPSDEDSIEDETSEEESDFVYNSDYMSEKLGNNFSLTYRFTYYEEESQEETVEITIMRNENGCYISADGEEFMFVKEGDGYAMCSKDEETGAFVKIPGVTFTEDDVDASAISIITYMSFYNDYADELESDGSGNVCGRDCDKYIIDASALGASANIEFYIDKATGVCLKYAADVSAAGEEGSFTYECIAFSLEDVVLPEYTE